MYAMKVATGTVIDGKVVVEGEPLEEGTKVTVVLREEEAFFELTPEEEAEVLASIAEIERGEYISGEELLERLRRFG
jgi:diadenosine tetraphosphate (Ap4A) HIT family hydrolase